MSEAISLSVLEATTITRNASYLKEVRFSFYWLHILIATVTCLSLSIIHQVGCIHTEQQSQIIVGSGPPQSAFKLDKFGNFVASITVVLVT